jgi:hypothetical protein
MSGGSSRHGSTARLSQFAPGRTGPGADYHSNNNNRNEQGVPRAFRRERR